MFFLIHRVVKKDRAIREQLWLFVESPKLKRLNVALKHMLELSRLNLFMYE